MQVFGTVISVELETDVKKNGGGSYKGWELVYKTQDGEIRTVAKPVTGLRFNQPLKASLSNLKQGDQFTLEQEKNEAGFYDVKSLVVGWSQETNPSLPKSAPAQGNAKPQQANNTFQARDFEGKEERTIRQRLIVRQSSLTAALATLSVGAKSVDKDVVKSLADEYASWVFQEPPKDLSIDGLTDDIPY